MKSGSSNSGSPNLGNWGDKLSMTPKASVNWESIGKGFETAATLANAGLGIYSALNPYRPSSGSALGGSSIGAGVGNGAPAAGGATPKLGDLGVGKLPGGDLGGGSSQSNAVQRQQTGDKHLDILRQLLGVYQG